MLTQGEDQRPPYPLSWDERALLFRRLRGYLAEMALFKVNTGTREQEVCGLRWEWEERVPELGTTVFVVPGLNTKNKEDRLIILNQTARSVVGAQRGKDRTWVSPYREDAYHGCITRRGGRRGVRPPRSMRGSLVALAQRVSSVSVYMTSGTRSAADFDLPGYPLRLGGSSWDTGDITTHYSAPELKEFLDAAERVAEPGRARPRIGALERFGAGLSPAKVPQAESSAGRA